MSERIFRRGRIWYGWYYESGERVQRSTRTTNRRAAEKIVGQWERDAADPEHAATRTARVRDALALVLRRADHLASTQRRSVATADYYRAKVGHLARVLEPDDVPSPLASLRARDLDRYVVQRRTEGAADTTIGKELGALRLALRLAKREGLWRGDADEIIPELESAAYVPRTRWLTPGELERLLVDLGGDRAARVAFIVATGARWGESDRALGEDVTDHAVYLRGTKTRLSARTVPIVSPGQRVLLDVALRDAEGERALFAPWGNARRDLHAACDRLGIVHASPNDLRRTFGQWLRQMGAPSDLVGPAMGHADARMVQRVYGRLEGAELAAALQRAIGAVKDCSAGVAVSADSEDERDQADSRPAQNPLSFVPRDGIGPPTRGFSILANLRFLPGKPRKLTGTVAHLQQPRKRGAR